MAVDFAFVIHLLHHFSNVSDTLERGIFGKQ